MRNAVAIISVFLMLVFGLPSIYKDCTDYRFRDAILEEIKDIKIPNTCRVKEDRGNGSENFSIEYSEPIEIKKGIIDIEKQLLQKGFVQTDNNRILEKKINKDLRKRINKKFFKSLKYVYGDKVYLSVYLE